MRGSALFCVCHRSPRSLPKPTRFAPVLPYLLSKPTPTSSPWHSQTVDWALTDWLVPTGVFAKQGTWIKALTTIVSAAGGYLLLPHPSEKILRVRHRYPVAPWHWSQELMPDFVLPVDAVERESLHWFDKPAYNRVLVSGQETGVLGQVTRAGTAGDMLAALARLVAQHR